MVCCAENGGHPEDDWTTCSKDRGALLDRVSSLSSLHSCKLRWYNPVCAGALWVLHRAGARPQRLWPHLAKAAAVDVAGDVNALAP